MFHEKHPRRRQRFHGKRRSCRSVRRHRRPNPRRPGRSRASLRPPSTRLDARTSFDPDHLSRVHRVVLTELDDTSAWPLPLEAGGAAVVSNRATSSGAVDPFKASKLTASDGAAEGTNSPTAPAGPPPGPSPRTRRPPPPGRTALRRDRARPEHARPGPAPPRRAPGMSSDAASARSERAARSGRRIAMATQAGNPAPLPTSRTVAPTGSRSVTTAEFVRCRSQIRSHLAGTEVPVGDSRRRQQPGELLRLRPTPYGEQGVRRRGGRRHDGRPAAAPSAPPVSLPARSAGSVTGRSG